MDSNGLDARAKQLVSERLTQRAMKMIETSSPSVIVIPKDAIRVEVVMPEIIINMPNGPQEVKVSMPEPQINITIPEQETERKPREVTITRNSSGDIAGARIDDA